MAAQKQSFAGTLLADRRRFLKGLCAAGTAGILASLGRAGSPDEPLSWQVGAAVAEIRTPLKVGLLMSSSRQLWEPFEGVRLPIYARVVVIEREGQRIAIVSLDLLGLAGDAVEGMDGFREQVVQAAGSVVQPDSLVLNSTHTHTSPESAALTDLYLTLAFKSWSQQLSQLVGGAVRKAADAARPCRLVTGTAPAPDMAVNRRVRTTKGIRSARLQIPAGELIGPEGPTDDTVRVAAFLDRSDRPVAILVNFTCHPVLEMCIKLVSPDYPGEMCLELERRHPGTVPLFLQGATGNINPPTVSSGADSARQYGQRLAELADAALADAKSVDGDRMVLARRSIELPARSLPDQPAAKPLSTKIAAARFGNAAIVFLPGEPFVEIALAIRAASPWPFTAVVGYSEDYIGYIPTDRAFENGGYETSPGRWSRLAPGSEAIVRDEAIRLLGGL